MKYAMTLNDRVIDIIDSDITPEYPPTNDGERIVSIEISEDLDIKLGMYYAAETGLFYEKEPEEALPTQLDIIQESLLNNENSQLTIMEALAEQYEENLEKDLNNMEVQATIYEAILELGGVQ